MAEWNGGTWVSSVRRELLDHIIPLNEFHLRRIGRDYLAYYHQDRPHIALNKNTPAQRPVKDALAPKPESCPYPGWAAFIIVTVSRRRRKSPANDSFDDLQAPNGQELIEHTIP